MRTLMPGIVALLAIAGCGGADDGEESERPAAPPPDRAARKAVTDYLAAYAAGDAKRACALMTSGGRITVTELAGRKTCASGLGIEDAEREATEQIRAIRIQGAKVTGGRATVQLAKSDWTTGGRVELVRAGSAWRIAKVPNDLGGHPGGMTICLDGGLDGFERREVDRLWLREGREDFTAFMSEVCRRALDAGVLDDEGGGDDVARIARGVLREMVRSGRVKA